MGFDKSELIGDIFLYPNYVFNNLKQETSFYKKERKFIDKSGEVSYWTVNSILIFEEGQAKYIRTSFYNETENVRSRKLLEKEKLEKEMILDNISEAVIVLNKKGEYIYTNQATKKKLKQYSESLYLNNKQVYELFKYNDINGNELTCEQTPDARVLRGEILENYIIIGTSHLPTTYYECNGIPIYDEHGNIEGAILIYKNIENILKIDEYNAVKENMKHLEIKYAILSYSDLKIKYINNNGFQAIKKSYPKINSLIKLIGRNFFDTYDYNKTRDKHSQLVLDMKYHMEITKTSYIHIQKFERDGKYTYVKTIFQPVYDEMHNITEINAIGMDVTNEETIKEKMKNALEAQEEIFINTSHELKTPINLIYSASQLLDVYLKNEYIENKKVEITRSNQIIMQNCYRLIKLINNILDTSKIEKGYYKLNLENHNIVKVIEDIVQSTAQYIKSKELKIIFDSDIEEKIMACDTHIIERVMLNLISNAIKFSNSEGTISVTIVDKIDFIEIAVTDNGIGIDEESINNIFNKFIQVNKSLNRNVEGTGIGLSLSKSLIELHGGKISIDSTLGFGSQFKIKLPIKTIDTSDIIQEKYCNDDTIEAIKLELSDIYP